MINKLSAIIIACIISFLMTSCGKNRETVQPVEIGSDFSETAVINLEGNNYTAIFTRNGADMWECEFTQPDTISGLKLTLSGDTCKADFNGLSYEIPRDKLPQYGIMPLVTKSLEELIAGRDISCTREGETITETGIVSGEDFSAEIVDGELKKLEISQKLTAEFQ